MATNEFSHTVALLVASVQHIFEHVLGARTHKLERPIYQWDDTDARTCPSHTVPYPPEPKCRSTIYRPTSVVPVCILLRETPAMARRLHALRVFVENRSSFLCTFNAKSALYTCRSLYFRERGRAIEQRFIVFTSKIANFPSFLLFFLLFFVSWKKSFSRLDSQRILLRSMASMVFPFRPRSLLSPFLIHPPRLQVPSAGDQLR